jgi:hypothetical protein
MPISNQADDKGSMPLSNAASTSQNRHEPVVQLLLDQIPRMSNQTDDKQGSMPLNAVISQNRHMARAPIDVMNEEGWCEECLSTLPLLVGTEEHEARLWCRQLMLDQPTK